MNHSGDGCPTPTTTEKPENSIALNSEIDALGDGTGFFGLESYTLQSGESQTFSFYLKEEVDSIKFRIRLLTDSSSILYGMYQPDGAYYGPYKLPEKQRGIQKTWKFEPPQINYWKVVVEAVTDSTFAIGWKPSN